MRRPTTHAASLLLLAAALSACEAPGDPAAEAAQELTSVVAFHDTYRGSLFDWNFCGADYGLAGYEPAAPGRYPVFLYTVGTFGQYDGAEADLITREMAARGFVAVSVQYYNFINPSCDTLKNKASCAYNPWQGDSALSTICRRSKADCWKGVTVGGLSQGSQMAILAKNYDWRVSAAWVMGGTDILAQSCVDNGTRLLSGDRLRVINGEADIFADQSTLQALTWSFCPAGQKSCLRPNGSGWYQVTSAQVEDGDADHCYFSVGGCTNTPTFDSGWAPPANEEWSLSTNLDWLSGFVTH
jgi:hypothetical protein